MELAPGVYSLGVHKGFATHAFLVADDDGFTLIDTLFDADGLVIANQLRALGGTLADLKRIVVTHAHRSHLGGLAALRTMVEAEQAGSAVTNGSFTIPRLPGGEYELHSAVWPKDGHTAIYVTCQRVTMAEGDDTDVVIVLDLAKAGPTTPPDC